MRCDRCRGHSWDQRWNRSCQLSWGSYAIKLTSYTDLYAVQEESEMAHRKLMAIHLYVLYTFYKVYLLQFSRCSAINLQCRRLETQPAVDIDAAAGEQIILENEPDRVGDLFGFPQAFQGYRCHHPFQHLRSHCR